MSEVDAALAAAARAVRGAEALLFTAGAGLGVDSGLPDFRGAAGFWRAYPPYERLGLRFEQLANPAQFERDPELAWGFYGHRLHAYRAAAPHEGFGLLSRWARGKPGGYFVFTSNVDGQFQKAGFPDDRVVECHGSIHHLQCALTGAAGTTGAGASPQCGRAIWPAGGESPDVSPATMRAAGPLPRCPHCGGLARPNILMFGDGDWIPDRTRGQKARYAAWLRSLGGAPLAVVECGAGATIDTVRAEGERAAELRDGSLVRINPRDAAARPGHVSVPLGALEALRRIDALLRKGA